MQNRRRRSRTKQVTIKFGVMAERFKAPVLKTGVVAIPPWVRIPLSPPEEENAPSWGVFRLGWMAISLNQADVV